MKKRFEVELEVEVNDLEYPIPADGDYCTALEEDIKEAILSGVDLSIKSIYVYEDKVRG